MDNADIQVDAIDPRMDEDDQSADTTIVPDGAAVEDVDAKTTADKLETLKNLILKPNPNLEIEDEYIFDWHVTNWRKQERRTHSPSFECGGSTWRLLLFPFGNNCDHVSVYLEHVVEEGEDGVTRPPDDWYRCIRFAIVLRNPKDPKVMVHLSDDHRFTAQESDWGFTRFAPLKTLMSPTKEFARPLVENEMAYLSVFVQVVKDPTGVLWHNFIDYDSKKVTGYVGLKNQGATCYLNSLLQSLFFTNVFRRAVYKIPTENEPITNSALALQRLFYLLQTADDAISTTELTKSFGWEAADIFAQQDVQELNRILMDNLETKMKGTEVENLLTKLFVGKTKTYIRCINVDYSSERIEDFWDIQLNVRGFKNLDESFKDYIAVETMDGENKYFAEGHGLQDARKGVIFESFPDVLHLHLKRFEYDLNTFAMCKVNDYYEFPEVFDASPYLEANADKSDCEFVLHGVLVHTGDLNAGHYYAFLRPQKDGIFYKFDDDRVTKATLRETMEENFGGDYEPGTEPKTQYPRTIPLKRSMNAYMLVYLRKSKVDNILVPIGEEDTPPHLKRMLEEEAAEAERRRKEIEEQPLYMGVKVITEEHFRNHNGFDIASLDKDDTPEKAKPWAFRFKKAAPVRDLVKNIADRMNVDPTSIRLWALVNRQNKTTRPDSLITEYNMAVELAAQKHSSTGNYFRVWVEQLKGEPVEKKFNSPWVLVFLKQYDPLTQTLRGVDHCFVRSTDKIKELYPIIWEKAGWPEKTPVTLFEEIKPQMVEPMRDQMSFHQSEIQDGDVICFMKTLSDKDAKLVDEKKHCRDPKEYYDYLYNLCHIRFFPKPGQSGQRPEFGLDLSKKSVYEEVAVKVAEYLNVDPAYLRFTNTQPSTGAPRATVKRNPGMNLQQMLIGTSYYTSSSNALFYEVLDIPLAELETKKVVKLIFLPEGISKEEPFEALVPKSGRIEDTIPTIKKLFKLDDDKVTRLRFFNAHGGKWHKDVPPSHAVLGMQDYMTCFVEIIPEEEWEAQNDPEKAEQYVKYIEAFHFQKEPAKVHSQGVPFRFLIKKGEKFSETRKRLQARTGIKGKLFEKIKFSVVRKGTAFSKPIYLEDDDVLEDIATSDEDMLGLDHADKNGNRGWGRIGGPEIRIR